jgi:site-specific recombinase XerD
MSMPARLKPGHILAQRWFDRAEVEVQSNAYVRYLAERGYARDTVERYFRSVAHFVHWVSQQDVALCDISESQVNQFLYVHLPHCRCAPRCCRTRVDARAALKHFLAMLGKAQTILVPNVSPSIAAELAGFERHLVEVRGLSDSTCTVRLRDVRDFLVDRFGMSTVRASTLVPADVIRFVMRRTSGLAPGSVSSVALSLRSYFRFKASCGTSTTSLIAALPRVAVWRLARVPNFLTPVEIRQLLNAFDRDSATGMRDFAITRCLLDLGLRRAEVANLRLDDIDWRAGVMRIHGKGKRTDVAPLPRLTGQAIAKYLAHGRPQTTRREVFVRHRPPLNAAASVDLVRSAVRHAAKRCGLQQRVRGTHIFRHTIACRMAQSGAPFKQIADLLRHRSLDTTTIYAKVDFLSLRRVALPWPRRCP